MKRTRSHHVSFRLNDKEFALLQGKLTSSGKSLTEFFIETISKGKVRDKMYRVGNACKGIAEDFGTLRYLDHAEHLLFCIRKISESAPCRR